MAGIGGKLPLVQQTANSPAPERMSPSGHKLEEILFYNLPILPSSDGRHGAPVVETTGYGSPIASAYADRMVLNLVLRIFLQEGLSPSNVIIDVLGLLAKAADDHVLTVQLPEEAPVALVPSFKIQSLEQS
jgi:hypothetical protein